MQKTPKFGKVALQKALKERLALLTQGLAEAEKGNKGIDLVKEIKELHTMLENMQTTNLHESKQRDAAQTYVFTWGPVQELKEKAQPEQDLQKKTPIHAKGDSYA